MRLQGIFQRHGYGIPGKTQGWAIEAKRIGDSKGRTRPTNYSFHAGFHQSLLSPPLVSSVIARLSNPGGCVRVPQPKLLAPRVCAVRTEQCSTLRPMMPTLCGDLRLAGGFLLRFIRARQKFHVGGPNAISQSIVGSLIGLSSFSTESNNPRFRG